MSCKVSVIIPFYNGIQFLRESVASVQNQTLREIEIILVDDGSTDGSGELADALAKEDARIRVIHQTNSGVSAARNAGLNAACGEYIGFVDADDLAEPDMFGTLYAIAQDKHCDIVSCAFKAFDDRGVLYETAAPFDPGTVLTHPEIVRHLPTMATDHTFMYIWRRLFSAALVQGNEVRFDPEIAIGEDTLFCLECFLHADRAAATDLMLYRYRSQPDSVLRKKVYKPGILRSLAKQYETKNALCERYCPEDLPVFLCDSARRGLAEFFPTVLTNVFRKPNGRYREYRAFLQTRWAQDTLQYADIPRSRSLDHLMERCMRKKLNLFGYIIARRIYRGK